MEKEIRLSFFKRLKMSIFDFDKYHEIAGEGLGRAMMYLVKIILLFSLVISFALTFKFTQIVNGATEYVRNEVPNFSFNDNTFHVESENDVIIENHEYTDFKIILSNAEEYSEDSIRDFDGMALVFSKNKIFLKQANGTSIVTQTYDKISDSLSLNGLDKDKVIGFFSGENGYTIYANIFAVIFITSFLTYFMTAILDTIALSLLGFIVSRIIKLPLKYGAIYSISISAITLPIIINMIYMVVSLFTGFIIPYFTIMYTLISYVYLIAALLIMKSEIIKKKVKIQIEIANKDKKEEDSIETEKKPREQEDKDKKESKKESKKDNPEPQANIQEK